MIVKIHITFEVPSSCTNKSTLKPWNCRQTVGGKRLRDNKQEGLHGGQS